ncbi:intercompartmental signaling factor BofC [Peribacillus kribbensis]|uniref:intercompartmental signaling factor BofC n=1 Tax=Peribacillus kribbensis TaxID=356658 RepID=UPI00041864EB|nr:intercompartmental signaling factor BofC [Peribacillus kribbensis]
MKYKAVLLSILILLPGASQVTAQQGTAAGKTPAGSQDSEPGGPITRQVILQRIYIDGEISEETVRETIWSMEDFWAQYTGWELVKQNEKRIIFQKEVNDISPLLKTNGYFGVCKDGTLSIFNGKPGAADIIQSFFQLDMKKLEGNKQKQLNLGIKISTKQQYEDVLETFQGYKVNKAAP